MSLVANRALRTTLLGLLLIALGSTAAHAQKQTRDRQDRMSAMGRLAARARARMATRTSTPPTAGGTIAARLDDGDEEGPCVNEPECGEGFPDGPSSTQSETAIAVDSTGRHVVVGFNDFRGFSTSPLSLSGFMYSDDGGRTFTDGGQLPVTTGTVIIGTTVLPQVFGDPDVKYLGGCTFIYSSILIVAIPSGGEAETMGVHRSTDCGHTWLGPYDVEAATNPSGRLDPAGSAIDAADKEFMDVDPDTGRVIMTWTNFGATSVQIRSAISDDGGFTWPVATSAVIAATDADGQASIPRFARGSDDVYVSWARFPSPGALFGYGNTTGFARSTDNGLTWESPADLSEEFLTSDLILGNDRSNTYPSLAVDRSRGRYRGSVYVVYANNNSGDGADIVFQKSTDGGQTFSAPLLINSRPGRDRAQWFPSIAVDDQTGRISVFYYDQGIATSGDLTEVSYLFSSDGGETWEHPRALTIQPFHAGHGNDTSQPNLGDYNQAVASGNRTWFSYALASRPPLGFVDGQPLTSMTVPDATVGIVSTIDFVFPHAPVSLQRVSARVRGRSGDSDETILLRLPLFNYATNPLYAQDVRAAVGLLTTGTSGVEITHGFSLYPGIAPGETVRNVDAFELHLTRTFVPGTPIDLVLKVVSTSGFTELHHTLFTGRPVRTTLLEEDFQSVASGDLPSGWTTSHGGGTTTVPWLTSASFCGSSNGAFHANANDGGGASPTRWERLFSPPFVVPADAEYVEVDFDVCYDTEDDPVLAITGYDGFFLRLADLTPGRTLRSVLAEAFTDEFSTGRLAHYPKHLPRSGNAVYFQDMSAWAGDSGGLKHVHMRLPGMQGSTVQLRFEFTQDSTVTCREVRPAATACGVFFDNLKVRSVVSRPSSHDDGDDVDDVDDESGLDH